MARDGCEVAHASHHLLRNTMLDRVTNIKDGLIKDALDEHREPLYRYALIHLRDRELAEDLVQATLLSAIESADGFRGHSSPRTWLISILKNKIIDHVRKAAHDPIGRAAGDEVHDAESDEFFNADGSWGDKPPRAWGNPDQSFEHAQFWDVFQACCNVLPLQTAQVFLLREVMGFSIEEICKDLGITASNCSVILHRARLRLRDCLERKWFAGSR
jgi:RNA polymerase sigma-70 factor (ECF subfamily)